MQFFYQIWVPHMDVKTCSRGVKTRKPFRLRSDYAQISFNCVQFRSTCAIYIIKSSEKCFRSPYVVRVPPQNEEEKTLDSHKLSTTSTKLLSTIFAKFKWSLYNIYIYICTWILQIPLQPTGISSNRLG